ncbi:MULTISPECIES: hypothetical protein [Streptomyces]|uniref:hypothetical protein n=1 Tax=Streptomyces TaxID=1883 RepID=UPI000FFE6858|nr:MULTISPECIES: hypothetical protein [Streptomyces]
MKRIPAGLKATAAVLGATAALLIAGSPAQAGTYSVTSNCDVSWISCANEPDLWEMYNSKANSGSGGNYTTSWASFYGDVDDYSGTSQYQGSTLETYRYVFNGNGSGSGQAVKNNAGSIQNCSETDNYRVYYNSSYAGHSQYIGHRDAYGSCVWDDLDSTLQNNEASQHFA